MSIVKPTKKEALDALEVLTTYVKQSDTNIAIPEKSTSPLAPKPKTIPTEVPKATKPNEYHFVPTWLPASMRKKIVDSHNKSTEAKAATPSTTAATPTPSTKVATGATVATAATAATASTQIGSTSNKYSKHLGLEFDDRAAGTISTGPNGTATTADRAHALATNLSDPNRNSGDDFFGGRKYKKRKTKRKSKSKRRSRKS